MLRANQKLADVKVVKVKAHQDTSTLDGEERLAAIANDHADQLAMQALGPWADDCEEVK